MNLSFIPQQWATGRDVARIPWEANRLNKKVDYRFLAPTNSRKEATVCHQCREPRNKMTKTVVAAQNYGKAARRRRRCGAPGPNGNRGDNETS
eukprot:scaffold124864_cov15-Prasinocladus_malaysianus.AAC.1